MIWYVVGCSKTKIWKYRPHLGAVPAEEAYLGRDFVRGRVFGKTYFPDSWLILSAKYGLIRPSVLITDYNVMLTSPIPGDVVSRVQYQVRQIVIEPGDLILHSLEELYLELLSATLPKNFFLEVEL
jgi:hypothetical protein